MPLLPRTIVPFYSLHISLSYSRSTVEIEPSSAFCTGLQDKSKNPTPNRSTRRFRRSDKRRRDRESLSRASSCMMTGKRARASIMSNAIPSYWSDPSSKIFCWVDEETRTSAQWMNDHDRTSIDPLDDDMVTGGLCLVVLAALRGQEAGGDHVASGTVVLVEDVQATFVVVAGVLGRLRDLSSGLAKQSLFLYALLLALSGLAAASVVASLFVSGHDTQLVGEAALVAGVASGAGDGSVTEEDDVEGDEEQEHDESFDGKESVGVHMEEVVAVLGSEYRAEQTTNNDWAYEGYDRVLCLLTIIRNLLVVNLISANPQHSSRKNSERTSKRKLVRRECALGTSFSGHRRNMI
ncbi:hypothetical protein KCU60_g12, partial [Aureobasidium melanogenum]